jgi:hypothetical protein
MCQTELQLMSASVLSADSPAFGTDYKSFADKTLIYFRTAFSYAEKKAAILGNRHTYAQGCSQGNLLAR